MRPRAKILLGYIMASAGTGLLVGLAAAWAGGYVEGLDPPVPPAWGQESSPAPAPVARADPAKPGKGEDPGPTYQEEHKVRIENKTWRDYLDYEPPPPLTPRELAELKHRAFDGFRPTPVLTGQSGFGGAGTHFGITLDGTCQSIVMARLDGCPTYSQINRVFRDTTFPTSGKLVWEDGLLKRSNYRLADHLNDSRYNEAGLHIWLDPPPEMHTRIRIIEIVAKDTVTWESSGFINSTWVREGSVGRQIDRTCTYAKVGATDWVYRLADTIRHMGLDCHPGTTIWRDYITATWTPNYPEPEHIPYERHYQAWAAKVLNCRTGAEEACHARIVE